MNRTKAVTNIVSFSSFARRSAHRSGAGGLLSRARVSYVQGQKEAFLEELSGYVDEVLGNRALVIQEELAGDLPGTTSRPSRHFRLLQGGKR